MPASLEEIRKKLKAQEEKTNFTPDNASYRFWDIPDNATAVLRFLPDADDDNPYFWVERNVIRLPFQGVKGKTDKEITVEVPCMHMYGPNETCPVIEEIKPWWDDEELKPLARKYYKKRSYIYQGFVVSNPLSEENPPENPIRRFVINPSIHNIIKSSLMDTELDELPTDYEEGIDFRLTKTRKGQYANYETSNWSRKTRSLDDDELAAIDKYGLFNLKNFVPKKPDEQAVKIIAEMLEASVNGDPYDPDRFANFYKPYGFDFSEGSNNSSEPKKNLKKSVTAKPKVVETEVEEEEVEETQKVEEKTTADESASNDKKVSPQELLAQIRAKRENKQ